ncbi:hypothetical protein METSCH_A01140 [Metschnikowia aff. pulcherrima]|uniref:Uncharacterized protein n=2 Tax=Metschnikowia TaxID=27320 RepID=A0A4P6XG98_9ASCO|nr:hypothetical protein METSCH_A01140 [Metschnikowia aff. pulcherrima]
MNPTFNHQKASGVYPRHSVSQPEFDSSPNVNQENGQINTRVVTTRLLSPPKVVAESPQRTHKLPASFKPREAKNMPLIEKITTWLYNIPWYQGDDGAWYLECYPGHASSNGNSEEWKSTPDDQDIFEQQARQITRMITNSYLYNGEITARPLTHTLDLSFQRYSDDGYLYRYAQVELEEDSDFT